MQKPPFTNVLKYSQLQWIQTNLPGLSVSTVTGYTYSTATGNKLLFSLLLPKIWPHTVSSAKSPLVMVFKFQKILFLEFRVARVSKKRPGSVRVFKKTGTAGQISGQVGTWPSPTAEFYFKKTYIYLTSSMHICVKTWLIFKVFFCFFGPGFLDSLVHILSWLLHLFMGRKLYSIQSYM